MFSNILAWSVWYDEIERKKRESQIKQNNKPTALTTRIALSTAQLTKKQTKLGEHNQIVY